MILNCTFIGVTFTHSEYFIYYVFDTIEIPETFMNSTLIFFVGGAVASWLVRSTPERAVRARALAGDIVLCS